MYVNHLRTQIKDTGIILPSAIALLNGHGSINCVKNMKKSISASISREKIKVQSLPVLDAFYEEGEFLTFVGLPEFYMEFESLKKEP